MTGNKPRSTLSFMKQKVQSPNQMNKNISLSLKQRKNNCCLPSRSSFSFRPPPFTAQPCEWNLKMFTQFVHHTFSFKDLDEQVAIYMAKNRQLKAVNLKRLCPVGWLKACWPQSSSPCIIQTFFVAAQAFSCSMINACVIPIWDMMKQNIAILVQHEYSFLENMFVL